MPSPQSVESWWRRVVVGGATIRLDRAPFRQDAAPCNYLKSFHSCVETRSPDPKVTGYTAIRYISATNTFLNLFRFHLGRSARFSYY